MALPRRGEDIIPFPAQGRERERYSGDGVRAGALAGKAKETIQGTARQGSPPHPPGPYEANRVREEPREMLRVQVEKVKGVLGEQQAPHENHSRCEVGNACHCRRWPPQEGGRTGPLVCAPCPRQAVGPLGEAPVTQPWEVLSTLADTLQVAMETPRTACVIFSKQVSPTTRRTKTSGQEGTAVAGA